MATNADRPLRVLLPNNVDRRKSAISTLMREVASRLDEFQFYAFSSPEDEEDRLHAGAFWQIAHVRQTSKPAVVTRKYDIVWHASVTPANLLCCAAARTRGLGGTHHVFTANVEMGSSLRYAKLFKLALRYAKTVVAVSEAVKRSTAASYGVEADMVIPNGFDAEFYTMAEPGQKIPDTVPEPRRPYFLFCGALTERKRPDVLIEIAKQIPEAEFLVVGGNLWPEQGDRYLAEMGKLPNVHYLGYRPRGEARDLMQHARALIFPSEREGLPLSVIEAMGCGCPVLAQPKSSLPEVVIDGKNGWLLADDPDIWADRCREILGWDETKRQRYAHEVRSTVTGRFEWGEIAASYRDLFVRLADRC